MIRRHRIHDAASPVHKENHTVTRLTRLTLIATLSSFALLAAMAANASPALAQCSPPPLPGESHPCVTSFGSFSDPNGIAVDEASGSVYVADIGTQTVYKFDAAGNPVNFTAGAGVGTNELTGAFEFPAVTGNPAALAVDNSCAQQQPPLTGQACQEFDPSAGDLYVLDAGHGVIDKFAPSGAYLNQLAGPFPGELLGLAVDAVGKLYLSIEGAPNSGKAIIREFDDSAANDLLTTHTALGSEQLTWTAEHGFAVSPTGDAYQLFSCGCIEGFNRAVAEFGGAGRFGRLDVASDLAVASDPATGHLYLDDGSSLAEWDPGQMNGQHLKHGSFEAESTGALVSRFGFAQLSGGGGSGRGGIAVDGATGRVYVSNPADGRVYVFATAVPAADPGPATEITQTEATLHATVNPRGALLASCRFEYATNSSNDLTVPLVHFDHSVPCDQAPAQIGAGTEPVPVTAHLAELRPGSLYRFRIVATGAAGASPGSGLFPTVRPGFGIKKFEVAFLNQNGTPDTQAGSHPYKQIVNVEFNTHVVVREGLYVSQPDGNPRDAIVDLPPGVFGDPGATAKKCTLEELDSAGLGNNCPAEAEIGFLETEISEFSGLSIDTKEAPIYSAVPPPGVAFQFAVHILIPNAFFDVGLPPGRDSRLRVTSTGIPATVPVYRTNFTVFGVPPNGAARPLLTLPTACNGPLTSTISTDSYQHPGNFATATSVTRNAAGAPAGMTGCAKLFFPPLITGSPDVSDASSPTGFTGTVHISQKAALNPDGLAEANLRDATVTLPKGVTLNPGGADGLQGCTEAQAGFTGFTEFNPQFEPGDQTATFTPDLPQPLEPGANFCPNGSKVGTAKIATPLLHQPLEGAVYLATPYKNPFGSLTAIYLIAEDPVSGTIVKQAGNITLDSATGQLVTTFKNTPDIPFEDLTLHFFGGGRAPLVTPARCGEYTTSALFTPWTGNGAVESISPFNITSGVDGGPCPAGGAPPFHPTLNAGTRSSTAGSYSPLDLELSRGDSEQEFTHFSVKLPPGLAGKLAGIPFCSDAAIQAAKERSGHEGGQEEEEHPSCPAASEIGHTKVGAGVGSVLVWAPGKLYLAGPYHGSPLSIVSITAAHVGAFDLGTVVVREALKVNPETAEVFVDATGSDPLPHIIAGVPTHLRKVLVYLDRPEFTLNPTSCEHMSIASTALGSGADFTTEADDVPFTATSPFQASDCASLGFKPRLKLMLLGGTNRNGHPKLKAVLHARPGDANIGAARVTLPKSEFLDQGHIRTVCTRVQFKEAGGNGAGCPAASVYGFARAVTPILSEPLEGPVYLRSNGGERKLPDLVAALHNSQIDIDLEGHIDSVKGRIRNTFEAVPDAPVTSFTLEMQGGRKGLLINSTNLCAGTHRAIADLRGHNGKLDDFNPALQVKCGAHRRGKRPAAHRRHTAR